MEHIYNLLPLKVGGAIVRKAAWIHTFVPTPALSAKIEQLALSDGEENKTKQLGECPGS